MNIFYKAARYVLYLLIFLLITVPLLQSKLFLSPFLFAYFGFQLVGAVLCIGAGLLVVWRAQFNALRLWPVLFLGLYVLYSLLQGTYIIHNAFNFGHLYYMVQLLVFVSYMLLFATKSIDFGIIARFLSLCVLAEGVLCILQHFDIVGTYGHLFEVYGSMPNPNSTAMFLAMSLPALLYSIYNDTAFYRKTALFALSFMVIALFLLKCRTAFVGALFGTTYFMFYQYQGAEKIASLWRVMSLKKITLFASLLIVFFVALGTFLYSSKQASSDGRLMIWKICSSLCASQPIFGYGTHRFEKAYNLAQAEYFQSGNASEIEQFSAAHVTVSYNDYLLTFIEGGCIGFALFVAFIGSLLVLCFSKTPKSSTICAALSGVLTFSVMSLFSSQLFITALLGLMLMYAAILCSIDIVSGFTFSIRHKYFRWTLGMCLSLLGLFFLISQSNMAVASHKIRVAMNMAKKEKLEKSLALLEKQTSILYFSDQLWCTYASVLQHAERYQEALDKYKIAENLTSDPGLFLEMSNCYAQLGQYENAIQKCSLAMNIIPNRILPRFTLMNLYIAKQDSSTAKKLAYEILAQTPKGISKDASFYKQEAQKYIDSMKKNN